MLWINFINRKGIARINGIPYNPQSQGAVKVFNRTIQNLMNSAKEYKKEKVNLVEYYHDFLIY